MYVGVCVCVFFMLHDVAEWALSSGDILDVRCPCFTPYVPCTGSPYAPYSCYILYDMLSLCLCTPPTWSLFGSYARCAQDGPSFSIQAWPSHSRWYCKTCIHGSCSCQPAARHQPRHNPTQSVAFALLEVFRYEGQSWPIISHHMWYIIIDHAIICRNLSSCRA